MKFFVLSDKPDVYLGMRLAGMDGAVVEDRNEALDRIREIVAAKEVGILLITGELMEMCIRDRNTGIPDSPYGRGSLPWRRRIPGVLRSRR